MERGLTNIIDVKKGTSQISKIMRGATLIWQKNNFILDQLSVSSSAAYSLRKLRTAYTGAAIRVRRSSGNAEADIGFATAAQTRTNLAAIPINNNGGAGGAGVTMTTVGTGTEFGQPYVEVRWQGTATSIVELRCSHGPQGTFNPTTMAPVTPGLAHAVSLGFRLVAGTFPPGSPAILAVNFNAAGGVTSVGESSVPAATAGLQRCAVNFTPAAGSAYVQPRWSIGAVPSGTVVNFTMRFYAANVEQGIGNARPLLQRNVPETIAAIGELDAEALLSFVGTGNGFVTTWYDQSGNGRNAAQTTPTLQPQIVSNGVIQTQNGRPTVVQTAIVQSLLISSSFTGMTSATGVFVFRQLVNTGVGSGAHGFRMNGGNSTNNNHSPVSGVNALDGFFSANRIRFDNYGTSMTLTIHAARQTGTALQVFKNGAQIDSDKTVAFTLYATDSAFLIDANINGTVAYSEAIVFGTAISTTDRQTLERNQGDYYGITVT